MVMKEKRLASQSLQGRITIANHVIYGYIWFILPLWAGNSDQLKLIDKKVIKFVWGGANATPRHRIAQNVLHLPKSMGGLGLLAAQQQASAFAATTVTWALTPGKPHPLKQLIKAEFVEQADTRWGADMQAGVRSKAIVGKTQGHQMLRNRGLTSIKHIADVQGKIRELHDIDPLIHQNSRANAAYAKIKSGTSNFLEATRSKNNAAIEKLQKWKALTPFKDRDTQRWAKIWNPNRPSRQASFLWLLLYSAIAVNRWRFPTAARTDPSTWCTRCHSDKAEDVIHLLWTCPTSKIIWTWAFSIFHKAFPSLNGWKPRLAHAILADPIPAKYKTAAQWWEMWRGLVLWNIGNTETNTLVNKQPSK
ncbi:hypothetical protein R1sor_009974 [Riccia sorocarpa]|uniref:Reverse transcriptase zinc-binding domain-containing protein n=1 Tax=Riccia sorocarpa TaxID=122646 RepID=A0ABD3HWM3_9MARC